MRNMLAVAFGFATAALLSGCATPTIDHTHIARPKTVAIMDIPDAKPAAVIGILNSRWPHMYFMGTADPYFVPAGGRFSVPPVPGMVEAGTVAGTVVGQQLGYANNRGEVGGALAGGVVALAIGSMIEASAEETQERAQGYPALVQKVMPGHDMRKEVLTAVGRSLEAKGIAVRMLSESRNLAPRLRWPALDKDGKPLAAGALANSAPVEADIVVQVVPMAVYASPGPLNNYNSVVGIGLAMYEGRTRKFLGWQAFPSYENKLWYARYDSLVDDLDKAAPAQRAALMSLVPQVSDAISGGK